MRIGTHSTMAYSSYGQADGNMWYWFSRIILYANERREKDLHRSFRGSTGARKSRRHIFQHGMYQVPGTYRYSLPPLNTYRYVALNGLPCNSSTWRALAIGTTGSTYNKIDHVNIHTSSGVLKILYTAVAIFWIMNK